MTTLAILNAGNTAPTLRPRFPTEGGAIFADKRRRTARIALLDLPADDLLRLIEDTLVERRDLSGGAIRRTLTNLAELPQLKGIIR